MFVSRDQCKSGRICTGPCHVSGTVGTFWPSLSRVIRVGRQAIMRVFGAASLPTPCDPLVLGAESDFALAPLLFGEALTSGWRPWALRLTELRLAAMRPSLFRVSGLQMSWPCGHGDGLTIV
jgi:hypothetical protein